MNKLIQRAQIAAATALAFGPITALAQSGRLRDPSLPIEGVSVTTGTLLKLLEDIAQFMITAGVIIAVIIIVWGGVIWMYKGKDDGKEILTKGIIGVAIVLGVGLLLSTVSGIIDTGGIT